MTHSDTSPPSFAALRKARFAERNVMDCGVRLRGLVHLGAGELDDLGPLLGFFGDEFSKVGRRHRHWHATEVREVRLHPGIGEASINLSVELFDDLGGRVLWHTDAVPRTGLVARNELT